MTSPMYRVVAVALALLLALVAAVGSGTVPALAAGGTLSSMSWKLVADGQSPFTADNSPGGDAGDHNGIVRTQDTVFWGLNYSAAQDGVVDFVLTLPAGMTWTAGSTDSSVCNGAAGGTLSADKTVLTCQREVTAGDVTQLPFSAVVGALANGTALSVSADADGLNAVSSDSLVVSAAPKTEIGMSGVSHEQNVMVGGTKGMTVAVDALLGAKIDPANPNFFGYESLSNPFSVTIDVPAGAVPYSSGMYVGGGSVAASQPGGPGTPITYTVTGANTSFLNPQLSQYIGPMGGGDYSKASLIAALRVKVFIPYGPDLDPEVPKPLTFQTVNFDPQSLSGQSNFGSGYAPGQQPGATCDDSGLNCVVVNFEVLKPVQIGTGFSNAISLAADNGLIYGDPRSSIDGGESVVVGQRYEALTSVYNDGTSTDQLQSPYASLTWNPKEQQLVAPPTVKTRAWANIWTFANKNDVAVSTAVPSSDYTIEYTDFAFADLSDRQSRESFNDPAINWVQDPSTLPGGISSVSSYRIKYLKPLDPNNAIGVVTPLQRAEASASLPSGTPLLWNWQVGADNAPLVKSNYASWMGVSSWLGGMVQASGPLVRAEASWQKVEDASYAAGTAERGDLAYLKVTPTIIGPVTGADATAKNVRYTVTFPNACLQPVEAALPEGAELTPAIPGSDCMSGTPAKIVFKLGDVPAPAGEAGPAPYQGHATALEDWLIPVTVGIGHSAPQTAVTTIVSESDNDSSIANNETIVSANPASLDQDRTKKVALTVSGASTFKVRKSAATKVAGYAGPHEKFPYVLSWSNSSVQSYDPVSIVDVLPFNGDQRGTQGLLGPIKVTEVSASMASGSIGSVHVEYTTDAAAGVETAVHTAGNESGATGVQWHALGASVPNGVTALRFTSDGPVAPADMGTATVRVEMPNLTSDATINNSLAVRAIGDAGLQIISSDIARRPLLSSASGIRGNVWRDLDFDGAISAADGKWPAGADRVELLNDAGLVATSDIAADGSYSFSEISADDYTVTLIDSEADGWVPLLNQNVTPVIGEDAVVDLLYQEDVPAANLEDDSASVSVGQNVSVDVTANDQISLPHALGSVISEQNTIAVATAPSFGTATVGAPVSPSVYSTIAYTAAATWPASAAGQSSYEDTFTYSYTNVRGTVSTANVTVTVYAAPVAVDDAFGTIADKPVVLDPRLNDAGDGITWSTTDPVVTGDATASYTSAGLSVTPTHVWGATETEYPVSIQYSITDSHGGAASANATLTVQRAPVAQAATSLPTIKLGDTASFDPELLNPGVVAASGITSSLVTSGSVSVASDQRVSFTPTADGLQSFQLTYTDNLGQSTTATYTVMVQAGPKVLVDSDSMTIGVGQTANFGEPTVTTTGTITSVTSDTADAAAGGNVTVDPLTGRASFVHDESKPTGDYSFKVSYTDDLGQVATVTYKVHVQPKAIINIETNRTIGVHQDAKFVPSEILTEGSLASVTPKAIASSKSINGATVETDVATGSVTFHSNDAEPGVYTFDVVYTDNLGNETTVTFTVTVQAAPVQTDAEVFRIIPLNGKTTFADAVSTTGTIESRELGGAAKDSVTMQSGGSLFDGADLKPGKYTWEVRYVDNVGQSVTVKYTVQIQEPPRGKVVKLKVAYGTERVIVDPLSEAKGTKLQSLTAAAVGAPGSGKTSLNKTGLVVYTPNSGYSGTTRFDVTVRDNLDQTAAVSYEITVEPQEIVDYLSPVKPSDLAVTGGSVSSLWLWSLLALLLGGGLLLARLVGRRQKR
ncbi:hypothetical protein G7068_13180 [Leucobacter viscericola]|uniref:SD-repeat containing protein B domain-containing protein n=1 Tax=Leucobacter viscericola TaxID=2714935 RepID=A0A6G7XI44_9MICO|nr:Ig-like domain-containing protein [Leucobacter viscericola]QIK64041.1 hypothetical protein G7068_13180 [Leucobacter viscericola]